MTQPAPPLVAAPRFSMPEVSGADPLLPESAPHRLSVIPPRRTVSPPTSTAAQSPEATRQDPAARPVPPAYTSTLDWDRVGDVEPVERGHELPVEAAPEYDVAEAPAPSSEASAFEAEPSQAPVDDGLAGIIAMFDAEVQKSRATSELSEAGVDEDSEERATIFRQTLAESRRRGVGVGTRAAADEPAPAPTPAGPSIEEPEQPGQPPVAAPTGHEPTEDQPTEDQPTEQQPTEDESMTSERAAAADVPVGTDEAESAATNPGAEPSVEASPGLDTAPADAGLRAPAPGAIPRPEQPYLHADDPTDETPIRQPARPIDQPHVSAPLGTAEIHAADSSQELAGRGDDAPLVPTEPSVDTPASDAPDRLRPTGLDHVATTGTSVPEERDLDDAEPVEPEPVEPEPVEPEPVEPEPVEPEPVGPKQIVPEEMAPEQIEAKLVEPTLVEPEPAPPDGPARDAERSTDLIPPSAVRTSRSAGQATTPRGTRSATSRNRQRHLEEPGAPTRETNSATSRDQERQLEEPGAPTRRGAEPAESLAAASAPTTGAEDQPFEPLPMRETVPSATVARFEGLTGIDLGFVPVNRLPATRRTASSIGARAFTREGTIHVPDDLGLDRFDNEALIAHELMHVAQDRHAETSSGEFDAGDWERQAENVERAFRGEPVPSSWDAGFEPMAELPMRSWSPDDGFVSHPAMSGAPPLTQRALVNAPEPVVPQALIPASPAPALDLSDNSTAQDLVYAVTELAERENERQELEHGDVNPATFSDEDIAILAARVREGMVIPSFDPDDPSTLERLAQNLYGHVRGLMRQELLIDRERSGVLTEFQQE